MESVLLDTPDGIEARLGWDPQVTLHDRRRILARELVADRLGLELKAVRVEREAPQVFGYHTRLIATRGGVDVPLTIATASYRAATVVAVADPAVPIGLDIRDISPDDTAVHEMRRHSRLFEDADTAKLLAHWTRVQAVLEADARGARVHPEHVRLDSALRKGWIPDRHVRYDLVDVSRDAWIVTLAYGATPA